MQSGILPREIIKRNAQLMKCNTMYSVVRRGSDGFTQKDDDDSYGGDRLASV
jgi:hypothetical protein